MIDLAYQAGFCAIVLALGTGTGTGAAADVNRCLVLGG